MENSSLTDSQVLGSSSLHSPSSEPPDIRNWFSSYVYESPELDSNDNFGDSISKEREIEEDELTADEKNETNGESFGEFKGAAKIDEVEVAEKLPSTLIPLKCTSLEDHRESKPLVMNQDSWCSHSLLSEPPDVGNWFSSYAYESPTLNSSQEFGSCDSENIGLGDKIEETLENVRKTKNGGAGITGEEVHLNLFKCNGNFMGNGQDKQPLNENLFAERTSEQDPKEKSLGTKGISPAKDVQISNLTTEGPQWKLQEKVSQKNGSVPLHITGSSNDDNRKPTVPSNSIHIEVQTQLDASSAGNDVPSILTDGQSIIKPIDLSNKKENIEKRVLESGFVTASKREFSGATYKKSVERGENYNNKEAGRAVARPRRMALSDKTNVEHSDIVEVIGKWSCPQKNKPNLGPPLKQLRLERWVHKV